MARSNTPRKSQARSSSRRSDWNDRGYPAYVPVAQRQEDASRAQKRLEKSGLKLQPIRVQGTRIAHTFWGKAWCDNLSTYSDYSNRLPRGRTYVRSGAVLDLVIEPGRVRAQVQGSSLYQVEVTIAAMEDQAWSRLSRECASKVDSLIELLQGKLSKAVMTLITRPAGGLFPRASELTFRCSCPDWASMCKHVAATLYGVGARLDAAPELFFVLRRVNHLELISGVHPVPGAGLGPEAPQTRRLEQDGLGDLFGIDLAEEEPVASPAVVSEKTAPVTLEPAKPSTRKKDPALEVEDGAILSTRDLIRLGVKLPVRLEMLTRGILQHGTTLGTYVVTSAVQLVRDGLEKHRLK